MANENTGSTSPVTQPSEPNYLQKLWQYRHYLVIEPFFFFYFIPSVLHGVALQNFPLDKACRVNLGYNKVVCDTTLDKSELGIDCDIFDFGNTTTGSVPELADLVISSPAFNYTVCKAELEAQILAADVSGKRAPIAAVFPLIVLLFAGGWSDRYNKRKPCMILPIVGEALSFTCLLVSSIFFDDLSMEFGAYCEAIVPAVFGGFIFCLMAIYSYITIATPEHDRIFRFGIFGMFINAVPFIGQPISGWLFQQLGYTMSFAFAIAFHLIAIFYIIFFIKEVKAPTKNTGVARQQPSPPRYGPPELNSADNLGYDVTNLDELQVNKNVNFELSPQLEPPAKLHEPPAMHKAPVKCALLRELFDPTLVIECIRFPLIKRENNGRLLLFLLLLAYFLSTGPVTGEGEYWYRYALKKLSWNGNDYSIYSTFSSALGIVGTFIGTAILSKLLKFSDSTIGVLSATPIVISRVLFAFSKDTTSFYIAGIMDMFVSMRVITIKAMSSSIVDGEELSKMYSIFGISDPIGQFIFPLIYSEIYKSTADSFPGAIFLFSNIFYVPNILVFLLCYIILRRQKSKQAIVELAQNQNKNGHSNPDCEITSL